MEPGRRPRSGVGQDPDVRFSLAHERTALTAFGLSAAVPGAIGS